MALIEGEKRGKGGRKPTNEVLYEDMGEWMEGIAISNGNIVRFKIDNDDFEKVQTRNWYVATGGKYIGSHININGKYKVLYLHNFIMNKLTFEGKGQLESVDHINRDGLDNRKINLHIISQSLQNINQKARGRTATLPEGISDLPRHIWYIKPNGLHGDRFCVEIKSEKIIWKTTSSKSISLQEKFDSALKKLAELYEIHSYLKV